MQNSKPLSATFSTYGFTLLELVLVITLSSLFFTSFSLLLSGSLDAFFLNRDINSGTMEIRVTLDRISAELRMIPDNDSINLDISKTNELNFLDNLGNSIRYWRNGTNLQRNTRIIAEDISSFSIEYLNSDLTAPATAANETFCINVAIVGSFGGQNRLFVTSVFLRKP